MLNGFMGQMHRAHQLHIKRLLHIMSKINMMAMKRPVSGLFL